MDEIREDEAVSKELNHFLPLKAGVNRRKGTAYPIATKEQEGRRIVSMIEFKGDIYMATAHNVYKMVEEEGKQCFKPLEIKMVS